MGKPFIKELENIPQTLQWAFAEPVHNSLEQIIRELSEFPLFIVGSGGSLSCAHFIAKLHERETGKMCRAITPLELLFLDVNPLSHGILFVTAGGNNKDIINAVKAAIRKEFAQIAISCSAVGSKIAALSNKYPYIHLYEYNNPTGKDGFLAVNTLLSTCVLFARAYGAIDSETEALAIQQIIDSKTDHFDKSWDNFLNRNTIAALGGEWSWPALTDLESKCTEAGLRNVLITDLKNFSHGRHNWFDKKGNESALLILETPSLAPLTKKITSLLPPEYLKGVLRTRHTGPLAAIDLFIQVFYLVQRIGVLSSIDPGRPQVPAFGRKMYHIGLPLSSIRKKCNREAWLARKAYASDRSVSSLEPALAEFSSQLRGTFFSGIVFDYDGTLCDNAERFTRPKPEIATALNRLLASGISIGIATGRGRSVQRSLLEVIDEKFRSRVVVGNYNGSLVSKLPDPFPEFDGNTSPAIREAYKAIQEDSFLRKEIEVECRKHQISVTSKGHFSGRTIFNKISHILPSSDKVRIVQSSHSIDILDSAASKVHVVDVLRNMLRPDTQDILVIGDQGQLNGNDFEMLNRPYSLSVDKVSPSTIHCWNLSPIGRRGTDATIAVINAMLIHDGRFQLDTEILEREMT